MMRMARRGGAIAAVCALALGAAACGSSPSSPTSTSQATTSSSGSASQDQPLQNVTIGLTSFNSLHIEFLVAMEEGLMKPYGINLKLPTVQNVTLGIPGVVSGSLQFAPGTSADTVLAQQKEPDVVAVGAEDSGLPYQIIAGKNITSLSQLKGKTIGVNAVGASLDYLAIAAMLHQQDPKILSQVHFVNAGTPSQRVAALASGKVAAIGEFPPETLKLEAEGFHSVANPNLTTPTQMTLILASKSWLSSHHSLAVKFMEGYIASLNWLNNPANKSKAIADIAKEMNVPQSQAASTYDTFLNQLHQFPCGAAVALSTTKIKNGLDYLRAAGVKIPSNVNIPSIYDNSLVNYALQADPSLKTCNS